MLLNKLKYILPISIFITLFLAAGPAAAQFGFDEWDGNDNDLIENEEFGQGLLDTDYYSTWDTDADGILTEEEWEAGSETWGDFKEEADVEFSDWDLNDDNELTEDEFDNGFFDTIDDDDSDTIDEDEWSLFDLEEDGLF